MSQRFRILHCLRAPVGGLFRHVLDLAAVQSARGHDVGILSDSTTGDRLTEMRFNEIAPNLSLGLHRIPMKRTPGLGDISAALMTAKLARRLSAGILHGHGAKGGTYARLASLRLRASGERAACIYTPHGGTLHYSPASLAGRIYLAAEAAMAAITDGIIFESAYARDLYVQRIGEPRCATRIIPNGLQPRDFITHVPAPDASDILFVGELRALKGVDVLLEALHAIRPRREVSALIVGSGPDGEALKALARELGLQKQTQFPGAMPARDAFSKGRCLVVPSRAESFPYIVLEAAAAGMPLISTSVGGIPEIVAGTDTPLLPADDVGALSEAILAFLQDADGAIARAQRLKSAVAQRFTVEAMTSAVLEAYDMCTIR